MHNQNKKVEDTMTKKFDKFRLTYLDTETGIVGINPEIGLLDLIAMTHPEKYAEIENKAEFLSDISQVNALLQEIYLRDNESRWQASDNIEEIDTIINSMPHLQPSPEPLENDCDLLIVPGSTGISMSAMFATIKKAILEGIKVKNIAVLGCEQEWRAEWVNEVKTVFSLRPDLLKEGIDLELIDFAKIYTEHGVNALISQLIDLGDSNIHFEFLPVPMKILNDGRVVKPNTNDEASVLKQYYRKLQDEMGANPVTMLVSPKGFHLRQSFCYVEAGIGDVKVLMSDPAILGAECASQYEGLVNPSTRAKLDNLAKTIYQTLQIIKTIYQELSVQKVSNNPYSMLQMMSPKNSVIVEEESKADQVTPSSVNL